MSPETTHPNPPPTDTKDPDPEIPGLFICYGKEDHPWIHTPLERGIYRWLREQAYQAAHDPDREWHGAVAEYQQLKEGTHPDPNPAAIIFPDQPELYDPQQLDINTSDMELADSAATRLTCHPIWNDGEWQPRDPKKEATECYKQLDEVIASQERRVARLADYIARHPDEDIEPVYYPVNPPR